MEENVKLIPIKNIVASIKNLIKKSSSKALMEKPEDLDNHRRTMIKRGSQLHSTHPEYGDSDYYIYHCEGVEEQIKDDKLYKVWYSRRDASDPQDSTSWYHIYYIEEVSELRMELIKSFKALLAEIE